MIDSTSVPERVRIGIHYYTFLIERRILENYVEIYYEIDLFMLVLDLNEDFLIKLILLQFVHNL